MINFFDVLELLCVLILLKIELEGKYNIKRERERERKKRFFRLAIFVNYNNK